MTMHTFSYVVPNSTSATTVKTFTFPAPVLAGSYCMDWAFISCCPGNRQLRRNWGAAVGLQALGSATGLHYQSFRERNFAGTSLTGRVAIQSLELQAWYPSTGVNCAGATVEMKACITLSDFTPGTAADADCVCGESCVGPVGNPPSYVGVTGVT